jgi:hypothetical protein
VSPPSDETMEALVRRLRQATQNQQQGSLTHAPSKRSVKNKSGRTNVKRYSSQQALKRAGGIDTSRGLQRAIYAPADPHTGEPAKLCRTYQDVSDTNMTADEAARQHRFTNDPQGEGTNPSQYSYYPGGRGA